MPYDEFVGWMLYLKARPIGWREDDRTLKLLQAQGCKEKGETLFMSLRQMKENQEAVISDQEEGFMTADAFKASSIFQKMREAKGGDRLDL